MALNFSVRQGARASSGIKGKGRSNSELQNMKKFLNNQCRKFTTESPRD